MRNLLLTIVIAALLVWILPHVLSSKHFPALARKAEPAAASTTPLPGPASSAGDGWVRHPSGLGGRGGLGAATLREDGVGGLQVYTADNLPSVRDGQIVRIRFSRPSIHVAEHDAHNYYINIDDKDHGGVAVVMPKTAAQKLALPYSKTQPGLTFFIALESSGLRAVGTQWRADTRSYTW